VRILRLVGVVRTSPARPSAGDHGWPFSATDVFWALSGLETHDPETGELDGFVLTVARDDMLRHLVAESAVVAGPIVLGSRFASPTSRSQAHLKLTGRAARGAAPEAPGLT
jgi:hypothetical protein